MKKNLLYILLAVFSLAFAACEDVPAPYGVPTGSSSKVKVPPYSESFSSSLGKFQSVLQSGDGAWVSKSGYAMAKGYDSSLGATIAGCYYLISPEIDLTNLTEAHVAYEYIIAYNADLENQKVLISSDYTNTKKPAEATWVTLKCKNHTATSSKPDDWNTFASSNITIPKAMMGKIVRIAFAYNCVASGGSTWEVKNFSIQEGKGTEEPEDEGYQPLKFADFCNGDFETWTTDSLCKNWETISAANNTKTAKSTDAHSGAYALKIVGDKVIKRLGYYEMKMDAGTYNVSFWAKAATSADAKVRPGYCTITDYKAAVSPTYAESGTTVSSASWSEITYSFTLTKAATIALVIQNQNKKDVLIDDYTIVKAQ